MRYSEAFKAKMVQRMSSPDGVSAYALSEDVGVHQTTLSRWLLEAGRVESVSKRKKQPRKTKPSTGTESSGRRPDDWTPAEKLEAVMEAAGLPEDELGEFLRRKGLHEEQLEQWREQVKKAGLESLGDTGRRGGRASPEAKRLRELEKELRRKDKALAEASALLVLKKKAQAIWGDEDDDTDPRNGK